MRTTLRLIEVITDWIGKIASFLMIAIVGYMIASVVIRYFLHGAINYMSIVPNIFYVYVCLGAAYAYNQRAFITVDILYRKFSLRVRAVFDLVTSFFFFVFIFVLLLVSSHFALQTLATFRFDPVMLITPERWPITIIFPVGPIMLFIAGTVRFIRNVLILISGKEEEIGGKTGIAAEVVEK